MSRLSRVRGTFAGRVPRLAVGEGRHLRPVTVRIGPWLPGWSWRVLAGVVALAMTMIIGSGAGGVILVVIFALMIVFRPAGAGLALQLVVVGAQLVIFTDGFDARTFALVLGVHLVAQLGLIGRAGWDVRVELAGLLPTARRFVAVQVPAQLLALLAAGITAQRVELAWLAPVAMVGLLGLAVWLLPQLAEPPVATPVGPTAR